MKLLVIFIANIILLVLSVLGIVHVCVTNEVYLFAPFLLLYILSTIILMFTFAKYISSRKIKINNEQFFNFREETKFELYAKKKVMYFHYFIKEKKSDLKPILKYLKKECL